MEGIIIGLAAAFFRALGVICLLPLGAGAVGFARHIAISAGAALILIDIETLPNLPQHPSFTLLLLEFSVGFLLGLPAALAVDCARTWGQLADSGRGQTLGDLYDPVSNVQVSFLGMLTSQFVLVTILSAGILEELLSALLVSIERLPLGKLALPAFLDSAEIALAVTAAAASGVFSAYLIFGGMFFVVDCMFVCVSKALPATSFLIESFQIKTYSLLLLLVILSRVELSSWLMIIARPRLELLA